MAYNLSSISQLIEEFIDDMKLIVLTALLFSQTFAIQPTVIVHGGAGAVEKERVLDNF